MITNWIEKLRFHLKSFVNEQNLIYIVSVSVGIIAGLVAYVIKTLVHTIRTFLADILVQDLPNWVYLIYPVTGIFLTVVFIKYILRQNVNHGIPSVLYAISKRQGFMKAHNMFSSIIASALTVGFGGSVGLEGPSVATGAAYGAYFGRLLKVDYKQRILFLGAASAGAMSAIFKAPIAGIVFAVEVIMLDLTMSSIIPLLFASFSAYITSYFLLGKDVLYPFSNTVLFNTANIPWILILGVITGLLSVYFTKVYLNVYKVFDKIKKNRNKLLIGGLSLGVLIFLFPSLYGEGYLPINQALHVDYSYLFDNSLFFGLKDSFWMAIILLILIILLKIVATSITFASGGIGGIFAPTLFMGANTGLLFALLMNHFFAFDLPIANFALIGMGGLIAGVLQAPLTAMFLIADLTSGYQMLVPLMIVSAISYTTVRYFIPNNLYSIQLAERGELMTHHADKNILKLMQIENLIEYNFAPVHPDMNLGDLVNVIKNSTRNVFPVVNIDNDFLGIVTLDDIREIMFNAEMYESVYVKELMFMPVVYVDINDTMEVVAHKIQSSGRFNVVVLNDGKYVGFVSRANVFSTYRTMLQKFSAD
jgi:CIC family chloride channel protein